MRPYGQKKILLRGVATLSWKEGQRAQLNSQLKTNQSKKKKKHSKHLSSF